MIKQHHLWILLFIIIFISCQNKKSGGNKIVNKWQGKEILIPDDGFTYNVLGHDTTNMGLWDKSYKILTYVDSIGCSACQLGLHKWAKLIDSCEQLQLDVSFLFVIHSLDYEKLNDDVHFFEFSYPLIYDYQNRFDKINHFPPPPYRTYLLDKNNKVQLIGSPIDNPKMWKLYKEIIPSSN